MAQITARRRLFVSLAALLPLGWGAYAVAQELQEGDHRALGGYLKSYLATDAKQKDKDKAKDEFVKMLEKIGKKRVEGGANALQAALSLTPDLGRAIAMSSEYKSAPVGKMTAQPIDTGEKKKPEYALWVPATYKVNTPMPLILCVAGTENSKVPPPAEFLQKYWIEKDVRDAAIMAVVPMPESTATWTQNDGIGMVMLTFRDVTSRLNVDRDRVYLLGRGEGVAAVMNLAMMFPQRFAAVVGNAGDAGKTATTNFQNLPTYFQGAGGDATAFETKNKELGYNNCTVNPAATVPDMWAWMQSHPRVANPAKITLSPGSPIPNKAYWIQITPTEGQGLVITAEADRSTNTITVKGTGVPSVTVFLNDVLVDLSKPVKVVLNGREQQDVIPRSIDDFLNLLERFTSDSGMVYVANKTYDLPE